MLCKHCSNVRFPAQAVTAANSVKSLDTGNGSDKECMPARIDYHRIYSSKCCKMTKLNVAREI